MFSIALDYTFIKRLNNNLRRKYAENLGGKNDPIHVSDILPSTCLRKQYYSRKNLEETLSDDIVYSFIRGELGKLRMNCNTLTVIFQCFFRMS